MSSSELNTPKVGLLTRMFFIVISFSLMGRGCHNDQIAKNNQQPMPISAQSLAFSPPEASKWITSRGYPIEYFEYQKEQYMVFKQEGSQFGFYVRLEKDSKLIGHKNESITFQGMTELQTNPLPKPKVPEGVRIASLVVIENESPPGWWATTGLMLIGFILLGGGNL
jgi:hypothetical protein